MRSKKNESIRKRKYGKKKSYKYKKCGCGVKLPFLKWGGDSPNGQVPTNKSSKISEFFTNLKNASYATTYKLTDDFNNVTTKSKNAFDSLKNSTENVIGDTNKDIENATTNVFNKVKHDTTNATNKTTGFFTDIFQKASNSIHEITKPKATTNQDDGNITSKPIPQNKSSTTSTLSNSNTSNSSSNSSSNTQKNYMNNSIKQLRKKLNNTPTPMKGGKRKSSKKSKSKSKSKKYTKSKKTKRRRHMYKHKGGASCMDGPVGIEKSSLAFTSSPISNINAVGPRPDQMYGQRAYPAWRFSNE